MRTAEPAAESQARLLARLVRVLLARDHFDTLASLTDALKHECARLRIRASTDDITDAIRLIASNRALIGPLELDSRPGPEDVPPVTRAEAAAILRRLSVPDVRTMGDLVQLDDAAIARRHWHADQRKAYRLVQALILETAHRAAALEAAIEDVERRDTPDTPNTPDTPRADKADA
jgi:hypothetical protein